MIIKFVNGSQRSNNQRQFFQTRKLNDKAAWPITLAAETAVAKLFPLRRQERLKLIFSLQRLRTLVWLRQSLSLVLILQVRFSPLRVERVVDNTA
jgi:hypothetical protein